jgi:hypothetical protein
VQLQRLCIAAMLLQEVAGSVKYLRDLPVHVRPNDDSFLLRLDFHPYSEGSQ